MTEYSNSGGLKRQAKETIRRRVGPILLIAAIFISLSSLLNILQGRLMGFSAYYEKVLRIVLPYRERILAAASDADAYAALVEEMLASLPVYQLPGLVDRLLTILLALMGLLLTAGYQFHTLLESRGLETGYRTLFYAVSHPLKALAITLLSNLLISLGLLLFLVPGVILSLRYSCALYIYFDHPDYGPIRCMRESAQLMRGHKWRLFKLWLSFLPWYFLSSLSTGLVFPVVDLWVRPYTSITSGLFYSQLTVGAWTAVDPYRREPEDDRFDGE